MRSFLLSMVLISSLMLSAQLHELSPIMDQELKSLGQAKLSVFVSTSDLALEQMEKSSKGRVVGRVADYVLVHTTADYLLEMLASEELYYIDLSTDQGQPLNDQMVLNNNIFPLTEGVDPLGRALTGEGVVMGIIDTGVELTHPDFLNEDGTTRILELWDHTFEFDPEHVPVPYGFGTRWTQEEIDDGVAEHLDQAQWFGHGSTVTGTACGNGTAIGDFAGVATKADMAIVSFDFSRSNFRANVAASMQYIFDVADAHQKPAVANMSLGSYYGSHDGLDPAALYIDSLLQASAGRLAVCAVGNSNHLAPYHLRVDLDQDSAWTWFEVEPVLSNGGSGVFFELWADSSDLTGIEFSMGADQVLGNYAQRGLSDGISYTDCLGNVLALDVLNDSSQVLGTVQYWAQLRGAQVQLQVYIDQPDSAQYAFSLQASGSGAYDVWTTSAFSTSDMIGADALPSAADFPPIEKYVAPDRLQHMVDSWACSDKVITVANYTNRTSYLAYTGELVELDGNQGEIYYTSSAGPTRDGRQKPDLGATGSVTMSTGNFPMLNFLIQNEPYKVAQGGMHFRNGGSSMASPVVAGVAALFLEQCPEADWQDYRAALHATAAADGYTGAVPNPRWGYGKLNGYGAVASRSIVPQVIAIDAGLMASGGIAYQWYLDGELLDDEDNAFIEPSADGAYQVEVTDEDGCFSFSEVMTYTSQANLESQLVELYPNPSSFLVRIKGIQHVHTLRLEDSYGRLLLERQTSDPQMDLNIEDLSAGLYVIKLISDNETVTYPLIKE